MSLLEMGHVAARLPAQDLQRAKDFYATKLGLQPFEERPGALMFRAGTGEFEIYLSGGASDGTFSQMGWQVGEIHAVVNELRSRGVIFEDYDFPGLTTVDGIATTDGAYPSQGAVATRGAWFRDSEGNFLGILEPVRVIQP